MRRSAPQTETQTITQSQPIRSWKNLRVLVVGLGRFGGGVGVTRWLAEQGAVVTVTDQVDAEALADSVQAIADLNVAFRLGGHDSADLDRVDWVVINPAVDKTRSPFFQEIARRDVSWTTEMNLFCERCPGRVIGVTGSYGKSTTCAMLAEALRSAGVPRVFLGGNIGKSLLPDLSAMTPDDTVVLEMSNAQLEDTPKIGWAPPMAVILNIHPHHLDRYPTFAAYADAKLNIARDPAGTSRLVVGDLHPDAERLLERVISGQSGRVRRFSAPDTPISLRIPGQHNQLNAACVLAVCDMLGLAAAPVRDSLARFAGLPHRLQHVRTLDGVDYYNDSKSTAPDATIAALDALAVPNAMGASDTVNAPATAGGSIDLSPAAPHVIAIVGGKAKDAPLDACARRLVECCRAVICTGESSSAFAEAINAASAAYGVACLEPADPSPAPSLARRGRGKCTLLGSDVNQPSPGAREGDAVDSTQRASDRRAAVCHTERLVHDVTIRTAEATDEAVRLARQLARRGDVVLFSPGAPSFDAYANFVARGEHYTELVSGI